MRNRTLTESLHVFRSLLLVLNMKFQGEMLLMPLFGTDIDLGNLFLGYVRLRTNLVLTLPWDVDRRWH